MIRVHVELVSAITGETKELARMIICNDGTGNSGVGHYYGYTIRGRSKNALDQCVPGREGMVRDYKRLKLHVWHLIAKMLVSMRYGK